MSTMNLTDWWKALQDDLEELEKLKPSISEGDKNWSKPYFSAAKNMAAKGQTIESNVLRGFTIKAAIYKESKNLGPEFNNPLSKEMEYLPEIITPEDLLFAVHYYEHLSRYNKIDYANAGWFSGQVLEGIKKEQDLVERNAEELKERIVKYCRVSENIDKLVEAFPLNPELTAKINDEFAKIAAVSGITVQKSAAPTEANDPACSNLEVVAEDIDDEEDDDADYHDCEDPTETEEIASTSSTTAEIEVSSVPAGSSSLRYLLSKKLADQFQKTVNGQLADFKQSNSPIGANLSASYKEFVELLNRLTTSLNEKKDTLIKIADYKKRLEKLETDDPATINELILLAEEKLNQGGSGDKPQDIVTHNLTNLREGQEQNTTVALSSERTDPTPTNQSSSASLSMSSLLSTAYGLGLQGVNLLTNLLANFNPYEGYDLEEEEYSSPQSEQLTDSAAALSELPQASTASSEASQQNEVSIAGKKQQLVKELKNTQIEQINDQINYSALTINSPRNSEIDGTDFKAMSSAEIKEQAENMSLIGRMINAKRGLVEFCAQQTEGIVKVTQVSIISSIVSWLSTSFIRHFMHDRLLLNLEANKLEKNLDMLIQAAISGKHKSEVINQGLQIILKNKEEKIKNIWGGETYYGLLLFDKKTEEETFNAKKALEGIISTARGEVIDSNPKKSIASSSEPESSDSETQLDDKPSHNSHL